MSTYLEEYLDKIRGLPNNIHRNFDLVLQLDESYSSLFEEVKKKQVAYVETVAEKVKGKSRSGDVDLRALSTDPDALKEIEDLRRDASQLADEKVAVASQAYDLVDGFIKQLDSDLASFEQDLRQQGLFEPEEEPMDVAAGPEDGAGFGAAAPASKKRDRGTTKKEEVAAAVAPTSLLAPAQELDPNEPTFCHCNRVSFGEMVACDNEDCVIEWFHLGCVGLTAPPVGKWYCSACTKAKRGRAT